MNPGRYKLLDNTEGAKLTQAEIAEGWHFCSDWDFMLIGPGFPELESCLCPPVVDPPTAV